MVCRAFSLISFLCKSLHRTNTLLARPPICERFKTKRKSFRYVVVAATLAPVPAITCFTSIIMSSVPSRGEQTEGSFVFRVLPLEPPSFPICSIHAPLSLSRPTLPFLSYFPVENSISQNQHCCRSISVRRVRRWRVTSELGHCLSSPLARVRMRVCVTWCFVNRESSRNSTDNNEGVALRIHHSNI